MRKNPNFEVVDIAGEFIAVPLGDYGDTFNGIVALNEASAFLLNCMDNHVSIDNLVDALIDEYQVSKDIAYQDVTELINTLLGIGLIEP